MGRLAGRLLEEERPLGRRGKQTPAAALFHERVVVVFRLEAQERHREAVLSRRLSVAAARVAARLGQDRDDVVGEVERPLGRRQLDGDRDLNLGGALPRRKFEADLQVSFSAGARRDAPVVDQRDLRSAGVEDILSRQRGVAEGAVAHLGGDHQLDVLVGVPQDDLGRLDAQLPGMDVVGKERT